MSFGVLWGVGVVLVGVVWICKRKVGVGIEGRKPAFYVTGPAAIFLGAIAIPIGLYVIRSSFY